ncbi:MAG: hypothetical protein ACRD4Y_00130, partial [Candidatus Acidiferrales bacterium]
MMNSLSSPWIPVALLLLLTCGARLASDSWLAPGAFAGLAWSVYVLVPLTVAPEYPTPSLGIWVLLSLIASIQAGAWLAAGKAQPKRSNRLMTRLDAGQLRLIERAILVFAAVATAGGVFLGWKTVQENGLSWSGAGLLAIGSLLSAARYAGENEPLIFRVLYMWVYPAALLGGMAFAFAGSRKSKAICFAAWIPALVYVLVETAKAGALFTGCCWLAGYLAMKVVSGRERFRLMNRGVLIAVVAVGLALTGLFVLTDAIRGQSEDQGVVIAANSARMKAAAFGYLSAFSRWMSGSRPGSLGFGVYTLGGLVELTGLHSRDFGVYAASVTLSGMEESNV